MYFAPKLFVCQYKLLFLRNMASFIVEQIQSNSIYSHRADILSHNISKDLNWLNDTLVSEFLHDEWSMNFNQHIVSDQLYSSEIINNIGKEVIGAWIELEIYFENKLEGMPPGSSGNKIMLTGTKGVGKTTLMKGLLAIIKKNCRHVIPIYNSFEECGCLLTPSSFLDPELRSITTASYFDWVKKYKRGLMFFGDDFDYLYTLSDENREIGIWIAQELLSLGKSNFAFCFISGSSSNFKALAHKEDPSDERHQGFPNMNNTVYVEYELRPKAYSNIGIIDRCAESQRSTTAFRTGLSNICKSWGCRETERFYPSSI